MIRHDLHLDHLRLPFGGHLVDDGRQSGATPSTRTRRQYFGHQTTDAGRSTPRGGGNGIAGSYGHDIAGTLLLKSYALPTNSMSGWHALKNFWAWRGPPRETKQARCVRTRAR